MITKRTTDYYLNLLDKITKEEGMSFLKSLYMLLANNDSISEGHQYSYETQDFVFKNSFDDFENLTNDYIERCEQSSWKSDKLFQKKPYTFGIRGV